MSEQVSVVLPYYNREDAIEEAIASVLDQTHRQLKLHLVDDGSIDRSRQVALTIVDDRVEHHNLSRNVGVSEARNIGLRAANDSLVAFMDSDDVWLPHKLEVQVTTLRKAQEADAGVAIVGAGWRPYGLVSPTKAFRPGPFVRDDVLRGRVAGIGTPLIMVDRSVAADVIFDPYLPALEDRDYVMSCLSNGTKAVVVPEALAEIRRGRADHAANPARAAMAFERMLDKYSDDLSGDDRLRSWYRYLTCREHLRDGHPRRVIPHLREALRHEVALRALHLAFGAAARSRGLSVAQRFFPLGLHYVPNAMLPW